MPDIVVSAVRTFVPWLVGLIVTALTAAHIDVSADARIQITALVAFLVAAGYYLVVRALEKRWPRLGVLLGVPKPPTYGDALPGPADPSDDADADAAVDGTATDVTPVPSVNVDAAVTADSEVDETTVVDGAVG